MKRIISLLLISILALSVFSGCGTTSKDQVKETTKVEATATKTEETKKEEPVTLKLLVTADENVTKLFNDLNTQFKTENPNVKVDFQGVPNDQYDKILNTKLASGDAPDVYLVYPFNGTKKYTKSNYLMPLDGEPWISQMGEGALKQFTVDGKLYVMPHGAFNTIGVFYDKKVFEKLKVAVPTNWPEFVTACETIKKAGVTPIVLPSKDLWINILIPYAMAPTMIYGKDKDYDQKLLDGTVKWTDPEWKKLFEKYEYIVKNKFLNDSALSTTGEQANDLFAKGKAAMYIMGSWSAEAFAKINPDGQFSMFPFPANEPGEEIWISAAGGPGLAISSSSKVADAAKKYLTFMAKPEVQDKVINGGGFPVQKSGNFKMSDVIKEMAPFVATGKTYPFLDQRWPTVGGFSDAFMKGLQELLVGKKADDVLQDLDKAWKTSVEKTNAQESK